MKQHIHTAFVVVVMSIVLGVSGCASTASSAGQRSAVQNPVRSVPSTAGGRYALVIGNAAYQNIEKLENTLNDARDIAAALEQLGFSVDLQLNVTEARFGAAMETYIQKLAADSTGEGFFWYAGHGVQIQDRNYLLPVDAGIENERTLQRDAFSLDEILSDLEGAHNKVNVVVLDACRNNPLPSSSRGTGTRGLAVIQDVPGDLFVMFSTAAGDVAADGKGKRNSPFAESFLKYVNSNEPVALMASDVINETMRLTGLQQRPFSRGSIISDKNYSLNPTRAGTTQTDLTAEDRAAAFYAEGMDRYSNQELDEAILYFSEAIRLNPKLFEAYLYRGLANDQKGSYDRAIADYSKAIDRQPNNALLYNYRGRLYTIKGNYQFALYDLDRAIFLNQKDASAYKNRGDAHYGNGSYDQAIRDYTEAIRLDPNNQDAKNNLETVRKAGH